MKTDFIYFKGKSKRKIIKALWKQRKRYFIFFLYKFKCFMFRYFIFKPLYNIEKVIDPGRKYHKNPKYPKFSRFVYKMAIQSL
jgi:hypothetical protein